MFKMACKISFVTRDLLYSAESTPRALAQAECLLMKVQGSMLRKCLSAKLCCHPCATPIPSAMPCKQPNARPRVDSSRA